MDRAELYHDDIHAWSEQQVDVLRRLARSRLDLPNALDLEHVAEEIEDVGTSQRSAAESFIRQILVHLLKLAAAPEATPAKHWRAEIVAFHNDLLSRFTPSMQQRIELDRIWQRSITQAQAVLDADEAIDDAAHAVLTWARARPCPVRLDVITAEHLDIAAILAAWPPATRA